MIKIKPRILAVDDESDMLEMFKTLLSRDYDVIKAESGKQALEKVKTDDPRLILLDIRMPGIDGIDILKAVKRTDPEIEVIMVTASKETKSAVESIKLGAYDYVTKPFEADELRSLIKKALERKDLIAENAKLKTIIMDHEPAEDMIGKSEVMRYVLSQLKDIAAIDSTVLITGESGTGKELAARALHKGSPRKEKPFLALNCAAIPDNLIESELFGYEAGAFTGASERRLGKFELANGGTIFLDEIGCMAPNMQAKLLRIIEDKKVTRVGGTAEITIDTRIIAATNIDFKQAVSEGRFREDLYWRLNVIPLRMPSLRERKEDIPALVEHFMNKFSREFNKKLSRPSLEEIEKLLSYHWPGNIRELQNMMERAVALSRNGEAPSIGKHLDITDEKRDETLDQALESFEKNYIGLALMESGGNHSKAARILGIHRTTLLTKMQSLKIK